MKSSCLAVSLLVLAACSSPAPEIVGEGNDALSHEMEALRALEAEQMAAWAAKDTAKVASYYATDAFIQLPNRPVVDQIDAIRREIETMAQDPNLSLKWSPDTIEIANSGEMAWSRGAYSATYTDLATRQVLTENGRFVNTYRRVNDGTWKIVADVPTPSAPPVPVRLSRSTPAK